jgi:hypothetical protein
MRASFQTSSMSPEFPVKVSQFSILYSLFSCGVQTIFYVPYLLV